MQCLYLLWSTGRWSPAKETWQRIRIRVVVDGCCVQTINHSPVKWKFRIILLGVQTQSWCDQLKSNSYFEICPKQTTTCHQMIAAVPERWYMSLHLALMCILFWGKYKRVLTPFSLNKIYQTAQCVKYRLKLEKIPDFKPGNIWTSDIRLLKLDNFQYFIKKYWGLISIKFNL